MTSCKTGFSLLEHHVCSLEEPQAKSTMAEEPMNVDAMPTSTSGPQSSSKGGLDGKVAIRNGPPAPSDVPVHEQVLQRQRQALATAPVENASSKRKTSPLPTDEGHSEKRQRRASADMDVDTAVGTSWSVHLCNSGLIQVIANPDGWQKSSTDASYDNQKYITKASVRPQGPGDQTDSRIALMLTGHKSEVFVCAFNPKKRNILASGWVCFEIRVFVLMVADRRIPLSICGIFQPHLQKVLPKPQENLSYWNKFLKRNTGI